MTTYKNTIRLFIRTMSVSIPYLLLLAAENVFLFRLLHAFAGRRGSAGNLFFDGYELSLCVGLFVLFIYLL